ncbi:Serine/threonine-protein kinase PknD [uncultured bacterium]|nr:Serine/threonine-protein kinase PknD [uncultured bacterium]
MRPDGHGTVNAGKRGSPSRLGTAAASLCLAFGLLSCSSAPVKDSPALLTPQTPLIWPSPPEPAKISYISAITRPADIGANQGFFKKLSEFILGADNDDIVKPYGVAVDGLGRLIVADTALRRVHVYDIKKKDYFFMDKPGKEEFLTPIAAAIDSENRVFVTDSGAGKVFVFSSKGKYVKSFKAGSRPTGIAINRAAGLVYVSDTASHTVNIYTLDGKLTGSFGKLGVLEGEFNYPVDLTVDRDGMLYVVDSMNFRVQIFDKDGRFNSSFGRHGDGTGDFGRPKGIAVDRDGNIYVADALFDAVQIFDRQGNFLLNFGSIGKTAGRFWLPSGLFVDDGNKIYVGDSYNSRVQVFEYLGEGS